MKNESPIKDMKSLKQLRDELKLQAHLFKGDVAAEWKQLEKEMKLLVQTQTAPVKAAARQSAKDIGHSSKQMLRSLKQGYQRLKQTLQ